MSITVTNLDGSVNSFPTGEKIVGNSILDATGNVLADYKNGNGIQSITVDGSFTAVAAPAPETTDPGEPAQ